MDFLWQNRSRRASLYIHLHSHSFEDLNSMMSPDFFCRSQSLSLWDFRDNSHQSGLWHSDRVRVHGRRSRLRRIWAMLRRGPSSELLPQAPWAGGERQDRLQWVFNSAAKINPCCEHLSGFLVNVLFIVFMSALTSSEFEERNKWLLEKVFCDLEIRQTSSQKVRQKHPDAIGCAECASEA